MLDMTYGLVQGPHRGWLCIGAGARAPVDRVQVRVSIDHDSVLGHSRDSIA